MNLETILVGVDFSDESEIAVEQAAKLARKHDAQLVLLHVSPIPEIPIGVPEAVQPSISEYQRILKEHLAESRSRLVALRERIASQGTKASHMVLDGFPDEGIREAADEVGAGLVVVGSHGHTGLKRLMLGSVAEKVVRLSDRSVLVARPGPAAAADGYHKILVPTDFSAIAERALAAALDVAAPGAQVDILHCWHLPPMSYAYGPSPRVAVELAEPLASYTRQLGAELVARHQRPDISLRFQLMEATPTRGILDWLEQEKEYSLVVTGSHGRRGLRRLLLGSVAESTVRHAPTSVLVVHGGAEDDLAEG